MWIVFLQCSCGAWRLRQSPGLPTASRLDGAGVLWVFTGTHQRDAPSRQDDGDIRAPAHCGWCCHGRRCRQCRECVITRAFFRKIRLKDEGERKEVEVEVRGKKVKEKENCKGIAKKKKENDCTRTSKERQPFVVGVVTAVMVVML